MPTGQRSPGLDRVFSIHDSRDEALSTLASEGAS